MSTEDSKETDRDSTGIGGDCLSESRLRKWLEERVELSSEELGHLNSCASCQAKLEEYTNETAISLEMPSASLKDYRAENEFADVRSKLERKLEDEDATHIASDTNATHDGDFDPNATLPGAEGIDEEPCDDLATWPSDSSEFESLTQRFAQGRYVVGKLLGEGGAGRVYLAHDKQLGRDVAIKILTRDSYRDRQRMEREAKLLAEIDHPHVVKVYDVGTFEQHDRESNLPYIVMEYLPGGSATSLTSNSGDTQSQDRFKKLARLIRDAAFGLHAAHQLGLIHRDVKPSNLLLTEDQNAIKVADFGVAKVSTATADMTYTGEIVGTPAYMSPEQIVGKGKSDGVSEVTGAVSASERDATGDSPQIDAATDVYSLGATLYTLITGQRPLLGNTAAVLRQIPETEPISPRVLNQSIPLDLETICLHAMNKEANRRYPSMVEFAEDLDCFLRDDPVSARPLSMGYRLYRWANRNRVVSGSLMAVAALVTLIVVGSTLAASVLYQQNREIRAERAFALEQLCNKIAFAEPSSLPLALRQLADRKEEVEPILIRLWGASETERSRMNLACALTSIGADYAEQVTEGIGEAETSPGQCGTICIALLEDPDHQQRLTSEFRDGASDLERAKLGIVALQLGEPKLFEEVIGSSPNERTQIVHLFSKWYWQIEILAKYLDPDSETDLSSDALCVLASGVTHIDRKAFTPDDLKLLNATTHSLVKDSGQSPAVTATTNWLREQFGFPRQSKSENSLLAGFEMVRVPAGKFRMGNLGSASMFEGRVAHEVTLSNDFLLADREINVGLFKQYCLANEMDWEPDAVVSPSDLHPAQNLTWPQAIGFCNWLSEESGLEPCYERGEDVVFEPADKKIVVKNWIRKPQANGFRLPTEAEFEFACRAGTETTYSFGTDMKMFDFYVAWSNNTRIASSVCGKLAPNPWGLRDMHGNVWEWCEDWYQDFQSSEPVENPVSLKPHPYGRVHRGGGVCTYTGYPESAARGAAIHEQHFNNVGLRVARNAE